MTEEMFRLVWGAEMLFSCMAHFHQNNFFVVVKGRRISSIRPVVEYRGMDVE